MAKPSRREFPLRLALLVALAAIVSLGTAASAAPILTADDGERVERTAEEADGMALTLSKQYMSPYCPGASLRDCTSGKAAVLRDEIKAWLHEGRTLGWIENELVARHGESILAAPRFKGFNALVWIFPFLALIVGLGMIFAYLQRQHAMTMAKVPAQEVPEEAPADPDLERRFESELSARSN
jgi:cytochrome c-type biogenesis protein CcmH/NrfF